MQVEQPTMASTNLGAGEQVALCGGRALGPLAAPGWTGRRRASAGELQHLPRSETLMDIGLGDLYSERAVAAGDTTERADMIFASLPYRILHEFRSRRTSR